MGILDDLGGVAHAVGGWAENLGSDALHSIAAVPMLAVDTATNVWHDKSVNPIDFVRDLMGDETSAVVQRTGQALSPLNDLTGGFGSSAGHGAMTALAATTNYTSKALATAAVDMFQNPLSTDSYNQAISTVNKADTPLTVQQQQDAYNQQIAAGKTPQQANQYVSSLMSGLSPGQAFMFSVARTTIGRNLLTQVPMITGATPGANFAKKVNDPGFDITNPEDRQAAFSSGFGKYTSGTVDAFNDFYLGPDVVAGKALGALREAKVIRPVSTFDKTTQIETASGKVATPLISTYDKHAVIPATTVDLDAAAQAGRVVKMTDQLASLPSNQRAYQLSQMSSFKGHADIQQLLSPEGMTADAMRMVIRNAFDPSPENKIQLATHAASLQDQVNNIRDVRMPALQRALDVVKVGGSTARNIDPQDLIDRISDMDRQLTNAQGAAAAAEAIASSAGSLKSIPRLSAADRLSSATNWNGWQPSRYLPATRILRSATAQRISSVDLNRPGSATTAAAAMLNRVGHAWGATSAGGFSNATKGALLSKVAAAESVGFDATKQALAEVEHAAFSWYAKQVPGLTEDHIRSIVQEGQLRRDNIRSKLSSAGDARYSGVTDPTTGRLVDEFDDPADTAGVGSKVVHAFSSTEMADRLPLLDVDAMARAARLFRDANGSDWDQAVAALRGNGPVNVPGMATEILDKFNRVWKPTQLLRLGWPMRIITDEFLRGAATHGAVNHLAAIAGSVKHSAINNRLSENLRDFWNAGELLDNRQQLEEATKKRAVGQAHNDIVSHLSALDSAVGELDPKIAAEGKNLEALALARAKQGLIYRAAAPGSKHLTGGVGVDFTADPSGPVPRPGEVLHTRVASAAPSEVLTPAEHATGPAIADEVSGMHDPGVATLRATTRNVEYAQLEAMSNAELRAKVEAEGGFSAKGLKSKQQLLSALGKIQARRLGYKAIDHTDATGIHTYTALHPNAVGADTYAKDFDASARRLQKLQDTRDDLAHRRAQLADKTAGTAPWSQAEEDNWAQLKRDAMGARDAAKAGLRPVKFAGTSVARLPGGQLATYGDSNNGQFGRVNYDLTSAGATINSLTRGQDRFVNGYRVKLGSAGIVKPIAPDFDTALRDAAKDGTVLSRPEYRLQKMSYKAAWERAVNTQIPNNPMRRMILDGKTDDEVVDWLRNDPAGMKERRELGVFGQDPYDIVGRNRQHIMAYLPTPELRAMANDPEQLLGIQHLEQAVPHYGDRPFIHGESLVIDGNRSHVNAFVNNAVDHAMHVLGTLPTDTLSRHPFSNTVYHRSMQEQLGHVEKGTVVSPQMLDMMQRTAHGEALSRTREVLYDLSNESHLGHAMRFMAPFYNAWQEALKVWGNIVLDDPSVLARAMQLRAAPSKAGWTYTDAQGNKNVIVPLPKWAKDMMGGREQGIPVNYVQDLVFSGQYWYNPGLGAPVTVPLAAAVRNKPTLMDSLKPLLPYGAGQNALDQLLPSGISKMIAANEGADNNQYAASLISITHDLETDRALGKINLTDDQMAAEAARRAKDLSTVRIAASYMLPYSTNYASPYQFYIDQAKAITAQYATYAARQVSGKYIPAGHDDQGEDWQQAFLDKYGEAYFAFTQGQTKSNVGGIAPSDVGYAASQKYAAEIAAHPQWGGLIAGDTTGDYNAAVEQYQLSHDVGPGNSQNQRDYLDPKQAIVDQQTQQGWDAFRQISTAVTSDLKAAGLSSINQKGAASLKQWKQAAVAAIIQKFPAWGDPENVNGYDTFTRGSADSLVGYLNQHVGDADKKNRPGWNTLADYLSLRQGMEADLNARKTAGGSANLQAKQNQDLSDWWDTAVEALKQRDTYFQDIYDRWLSNDKLENAS